MTSSEGGSTENKGSGESAVGGGVRGGGRFSGWGGGCDDINVPVGEKALIGGSAEVEGSRGGGEWGSAKGDADSEGLENGSTNWLLSKSECVGDGVGLVFISFNRTTSMLSRDVRAVCVPIPPSEEFLVFLPDQRRLARRDTSVTSEALEVLVDDPRAAFRRWRSAISHLFRF